MRFKNHWKYKKFMRVNSFKWPRNLIESKKISKISQIIIRKKINFLWKKWMNRKKNSRKMKNLFENKRFNKKMSFHLWIHWNIKSVIFPKKFKRIKHKLKKSSWISKKKIIYLIRKLPMKMIHIVNHLTKNSKTSQKIMKKWITK